MTWTAQQQQGAQQLRNGQKKAVKVNLSHTSELLLLLSAHPVDSEAGGSGETTSENLLVRLSPPVDQRSRFLCGTSI